MRHAISLFGIVVGVALLLTGIGFAILSIGGALRNPEGVFSRRKEAATSGSAGPAPAA